MNTSPVLKQWSNYTTGKDSTRWWSYYFKDNFMGSKLRERENTLFQFLEEITLPKGSKVLDVGFGAGHSTYRLGRMNFDVYGIDISPPLVKLASRICQELSPKTKFKLKVGNVQKLPYKDNFFDGVIGLGYLQYVTSPLEHLTEVKRVLKGGGHFIIAQYNNRGIQYWDNPFYFIQGIINILLGSKHVLRIYHPIILKTAMPFIKGLRLKRIQSRLERHLKIGYVPKNYLYYGRIKELLTSSGFEFIKLGTGSFNSKMWYNYQPRIIPKILKRYNLFRKLSNDLIFLVRK